VTICHGGSTAAGAVPVLSVSLLVALAVLVGALALLVLRR
jgi:hypothetical protein